MKRLRSERRWSQEQLAYEANIDRTYVSGIERLVRHPTITSVEKIAKAFGVSFSELLDHDPS